MKKLLLVSTLCAVVAAPIVSCTNTTDTGAIGVTRKQLLLVSGNEVMQLSNQAYQKTIAEARQAGILDVNGAQVARLKTIANRLIPKTAIYRTDAANWDWQVHVINQDTLNAYVMPSGKIVFYSGIIDKLKLTDDEIAAIMGHEMAHALREHSREQISRQVATQGGLSILGAALGLSRWTNASGKLIG